MIKAVKIGLVFAVSLTGFDLRAYETERPKDYELTVVVKAAGPFERCTLVKTGGSPYEWHGSAPETLWNEVHIDGIDQFGPIRIGTVAKFEKECTGSETVHYKIAKAMREAAAVGDELIKTGVCKTVEAGDRDWGSAHSQRRR